MMCVLQREEKCQWTWRCVPQRQVSTNHQAGRRTIHSGHKAEATFCSKLLSALRKCSPRKGLLARATTPFARFHDLVKLLVQGSGVMMQGHRVHADVEVPQEKPRHHNNNTKTVVSFRSRQRSSLKLFIFRSTATG